MHSPALPPQTFGYAYRSLASDIPSPEAYFGGSRRAGERALPWERWTPAQTAAYEARARRSIERARAGGAVWAGWGDELRHAYVVPEGDTRGLAICSYRWQIAPAKSGGDRCPECLAWIGLELVDDVAARLERAAAMRAAARTKRNRAFRAE